MLYFCCTKELVSTACKIAMKFEPKKGKIKFTPITKLVQISNFMGSLHAVLSKQPRTQADFTTSVK